MEVWLLMKSFAGKSVVARLVPGEWRERRSVLGSVYEVNHCFRYSSGERRPVISRGGQDGMATLVE